MNENLNRIATVLANLTEDDRLALIVARLIDSVSDISPI
jgi:hypothetical protein